MRIGTGRRGPDASVAVRAREDWRLADVRTFTRDAQSRRIGSSFGSTL
jgi:hypothetical protein